jgi:lipopolysaccharide biosynthesis glycosyltransferase
VKAKSDFLKSIEINFQNPDAHYHLALILIQENKKSKRKKFEQRICEQLETASKMNHPKAQELLNQLCQKIEPEIEEIQDIE